MISIGAVFHGPELKDSKIDLAILAASKIIKSHRGGARFDKNSVGKRGVRCVRFYG